MQWGLDVLSPELNIKIFHCLENTPCTLTFSNGTLGGRPVKTFDFLLTNRTIYRYCAPFHWNGVTISLNDPLDFAIHGLSKFDPICLHSIRHLDYKIQPPACVMKAGSRKTLEAIKTEVKSLTQILRIYKLFSQLKSFKLTHTHLNLTCSPHYNNGLYGNVLPGCKGGSWDFVDQVHGGNLKAMKVAFESNGFATGIDMAFGGVGTHLFMFYLIDLELTCTKA